MELLLNSCCKYFEDANISLNDELPCPLGRGSGIYDVLRALAQYLLVYLGFIVFGLANAFLFLFFFASPKKNQKRSPTKDYIPFVGGFPDLALVLLWLVHL